jgi:hypothetical protein
VHHLRAIIALLLSVALPYSATATMLADVYCEHDGLVALLDTDAHEAVHHALDHHVQLAHDAKAAPAGDHDCDCAENCHCPHCAGISAVALQSAPSGIHVVPDSGRFDGMKGKPALDPQLRSLLRPPNATPTGAA